MRASRAFAVLSHGNRQGYVPVRDATEGFTLNGSWACDW